MAYQRGYGLSSPPGVVEDWDALPPDYGLGPGRTNEADRNRRVPSDEFGYSERESGYPSDLRRGSGEYGNRVYLNGGEHRRTYPGDDFGDGGGDRDLSGGHRRTCGGEHMKDFAGPGLRRSFREPSRESPLEDYEDVEEVTEPPHRMDPRAARRALPEPPRGYQEPPRNFREPPMDQIGEPPRDFREPPHRGFYEPPRDFAEPPRDFFHEPPRDFAEPPRDFPEPPRDFAEPPRDFGEPSAGYNEGRRQLSRDGHRQSYRDGDAFRDLHRQDDRFGDQYRDDGHMRDHHRQDGRMRDQYPLEDLQPGSVPHQPNGSAFPGDGILRNRHSGRGFDNPGFSPEETVDNVGHSSRRRRYLPRSRSQYERRSRRRGGGAHEDDDRDSVETLVPEFSPEERMRIADFLATIRIKKPQRKSLHREPSDRRDEVCGVEDAEAEEEVGLPSVRAHQKSKSLTERLQEARHKATPEVASSLRTEVYGEIDPAIRGVTTKLWQKKLDWLKDSVSQVELWASHFKDIEGRFGSATTSYFRFIRWLVLLNFFTFLVPFLTIVVPYVASDDPERFELDMNPYNETRQEYIYWQQAQNCSARYTEALKNTTDKEDVADQILSFVIGTGWMEKTSMFYGSYHNRSYPPGAEDHTHNYNMGLAYLLSVGLVFLISFILIVMSSSKAVKDAVTEGEEHSSVHYTNSVLCGWDFCIMNDKAAKAKKRILSQEFNADLTEQQRRAEREQRTAKERAKLYFIRFVINLVILMILGGSIYLIYYTTDKLLELRKTTTDPVLVLLVQFMPSFAITFLNFAAPLVFEVLVAVEDYMPSFEIKITLIRWVFLRLSSLAVLLVALYTTLHVDSNATSAQNCPETNSSEHCCGNLLWELSQDNSTDPSVSSVKCWETYVGQQFYKLALVDFAAVFAKTFFMEFPRKLVYEKFKERFGLVKKFGQQFFNLPENVLDIVYTQTLSWLGMFFAPLLPAMTLVKVLIIFYMKKLTLIKNYAPPQNAYKASSANSFFMTILLISFILTASVIGWIIGNLDPSKSCGPFRVYSKDDYQMWTALTNQISDWPQAASDFFFFFGTPAFFVPCFIVLCLLMYCFWAMAQGYKKMESLIQAQLKMEGKDKQFLLARVNDILKSVGNIQGPQSGPEAMGPMG